MLQYDLTNTPLLDRDVSIPTEAEMFVLTTALMMVCDCSYSELERAGITFELSMLEAVAECIARRMPASVEDVGNGRLERRLQDFIGLRVVGEPSRSCECRTPG